MHMTRVPPTTQRCLGGLLACAAAVLGASAPAALGADAPATRGYEMITPADKDFGFGSTNGAVAVAAPDGASVAFDTTGALPGSEGGTLENYYVARRQAGAWARTPLTPPQEPEPGGQQYPQWRGFSPDLRQAVFLSGSPLLTPNAVAGAAELYLRDTVTGDYQLLTDGNVTDDSTGSSAFADLAGFSADGRHVAFTTYDALIAGAQDPGITGAYEFLDGHPRYVGILPDGTPAHSSILGGGTGSSPGVLRHAISDDGGRIFFTDPQSPVQLYVRQDGVSTTMVSASQRSTPDAYPSATAVFVGASADGGKVVFTDDAALTDDANVGTDGSGNPTHAGRDLYLYDLASGELTDLSVDTTPADSAAGANVQGVLGVSDDAAYVYFVALGDLGGGATSGAPNLYLWHHGDVRHIATLDPADSTAWSAVSAGSLGTISRVTPDGRVLAFTSVAPLTGFDSTDPDTGTAHREVYRYSADTDELDCASCPAEGGARGDATISPSQFPTNITRNLSDDGRRLFFDSTDGLVPQDTNGRSDVYEFSGGSVRLISTGTDRHDATFRDASASGDDVFFSTAGQLLPQDQDDLIDLYDARVGGGFPPPSSAEPCAAALCSGGPSSSAGHDVAIPASAVLSGSGNVLSIRLPKQRFTVGRLTAAQRRLAARTGRLKVAVEVTDPGVVRAGLRGRVHGKRRLVGHARRRVSHAGVFHLTLRLMRRARHRLAHHRRLRLRLTVTYSQVSGAKHATVSLHR